MKNNQETTRKFWKILEKSSRKIWNSSKKFYGKQNHEENYGDILRKNKKNFSDLRKFCGEHV